MITFTILSIGKTKECWLTLALEEYAKRLKGAATIETRFVKDNAQLQKALAKDARVIALDPQGALMDSARFSNYLMKQVEEAGARLTFVIGGPDGLPREVKEQCPLISLSPMTFTHQMTRLILTEQIYRAFEIARGSAYHR